MPVPDSTLRAHFMLSLKKVPKPIFEQCANERNWHLREQAMREIAEMMVAVMVNNFEIEQPWIPTPSYYPGSKKV